jgi:hypothetical protein
MLLATTLLSLPIDRANWLDGFDRSSILVLNRCRPNSDPVLERATAGPCLQGWRGPFWCLMAR